MAKKRIVFFTGAGISKESGMPTFRGEDGMWDKIDADAVANARNWYSGRRKDCKERRQVMLDFFNPLRRTILEKMPNTAHYAIAELESEYEVTVITQNGDDFHTRAGSSDVIYLHGEALKNCSSLNPYEPLDIDRNNPDIHIGDKAPDGSQIRPFVIYFNEDIDKRLWKRAVESTKIADVFIVIGSTMLVYPAAELINLIPKNCELIVIDPDDVELPQSRTEYIHFKCGGSEGMKSLYQHLGKEWLRDI